MRHVEIDVPNLVVAFVIDGYFVRLLEVKDRLRLQQGGWAERVTGCCRPERILSLYRKVSVLFHDRRSPRSQNRVLVVANPIVSAVIIAFFILAPVLMDVTREVTNGLRTGRRGRQPEAVQVLPRAQKVRYVPRG